MLYRSRLGGDLGRITLDFVSSVSEDTEIAKYDILASKAHTVMLCECKIITPSQAGKILSALAELGESGLGEGGGSEDIHELVERLVVEKAGMDSGGRMHTARSRNDQVAMDVRLKVRDDINIVCGCILDMTEALVSVAEGHQKTVMPLYTHMQQAQTGTLSHYLLAHADALLRDLGRFTDAFVRVNHSPLGAGPVGGTSLPIDRKMTAKLLGFTGLVENSLDATSTRDFVAEYVAAVAIMMTNVSRLAEDLVVWSSSEFAFVELSDELASPSSVMPQKKNPDVLELVRAKAATTIGSLTGVLSGIKGLASGYGRDLQQLKSPAWTASRTAISTLVVLKSVILTVSVNEKAMKKAACGGYLEALDVAEGLVGDGMPFRTAHAITGRLVHDAHKSARPLAKLDLTDIKRAADDSKIDPARIAELIRSSTASKSLRRRTSRGSAGFAEQRRMIKARRSKIGLHRTVLTKRDDQITNALDELARRVKKLTG